MSAHTAVSLRSLLDEGLRYEREGRNDLAAQQFEAALAIQPNLMSLRARIFLLKGFRMENSVEHNARMFEGEVLPALHTALAQDNVHDALDLESLIYAHYIRQVDTEEHYQQVFAHFAPAMEQAGLKARAMLKPLSPLNPAPTPERLGFFLHNASTLAHTQVLVSYLDGLNRMEQPPFLPHVYALQGNPKEAAAQELEHALAKVGAKLFYLGEYAQRGKDSFFYRLLILRKLVAEHQVSALTWVSIPTLLAFASAMGVAPAHVWWAMRFHPNTFTHLDGRIGGGALFDTKRELNGQSWRTVFVAYHDLYDATLKPRAEEIRARFAGKTILGTVARPEKLMDEDFLWALQQILRRFPDAVFLWTAEPLHSSLVEQFRALGIAERCPCIGWVDPKLYAQVFDLYIDTFPSGSGMTGIQAMAAATPLVGMYTHISMLGNFVYPAYHGTQGTEEDQRTIRAMFTHHDGSSLLTCATTKEEYVAMAARLIEDVEYRKAAGKAQQDFVGRYLSDQTALARRINQHYAEILANVRGKSIS